jgi:hypothetical protein
MAFVPFEQIPLEAAQKELLGALVEADRRVPEADRQEFFVIGTTSGYFIVHPGIQRDSVYPGDLRTLAEFGLIRLGYTSRGDEKYDVTPTTSAYYAWMKEQEGQPDQRIENDTRRLLDSPHFRERHSDAYRRWTDAEAALWSAERPAQLTDLGHACREAMQQFITDLVKDNNMAGEVEPDPQRTVARLRAVIAQAGLSDAVGGFAEALVAYFGTVSDLIQRQEHGGQKEGEPLTWEDGRRVVFQTAMVMYELERALGRQ